MSTRSLGDRLLATLDARGLVTWERRAPGARVLTVTNAWPHPARPAQGIFVRTTVEGLAAEGIATDVLFVRGHRGPHAYALAGLALALLSRGTRGRYALVHAHGGETALVARCFLGAPVLASYLGSDLLGPRAGDRRQRLLFAARSRLLRLHSLTLTATTTKSAEMERVLPRRVRARNRVIPDGVDRTRFTPAGRDEARRQLGWDPDEIVVISVGRRSPIKRLELAEEAVAVARRRLPALRWHAVTDVAPEDLPPYYSAADCLLHTSISEGSPNVVKEALACDLPVVATPSGDIPELLDGVAPSALCPADPQALAEAVIRCAADRRRSNGRARTERLGLEAVSRRLAECYAALADLR